MKKAKIKWNPNFLIKIKRWCLNRQIKKKGVFVGKNEKYKTISEAIDAGEKIILIPNGELGDLGSTTISKRKIHIIGV